MDSEIDDLVFGKNKIERIVGCDVVDSQVELLIQEKDGSIRREYKPFKYWILSPKRLSDKWVRLEGDLHYKYIRYLDTKSEYLNLLSKMKGMDYYTVRTEKEAAMLLYGFTYFKGIEYKEVAVLGFDIETVGLTHDSKSKVILISNTFRKGEYVERKMFSYDQYDSQGEMLDAWCEWVREKDPRILTGHNISSFDIPYLRHVADLEGSQLTLGADGSPVHFQQFKSKFRKDARQFYEYTSFSINGREAVDTLFLSIKYDFARKYESYGLKNIIKQEGLQKEDRVMYDASKIRFNYTNPVELEKIKAYCEHDADDALALFDLMIPAQFYFNRSVPKSLTTVVNSATGSPINAILMRSYLQKKHSLPKASRKVDYEGAISDGWPGIYQWCHKLDVASLYPSIILQYRVWDRQKDPNAHFYKMVEFFTAERLYNKRLAKETNNQYYKDLEQSQKIVVNSSYGLLGADGLMFNSPENASLITRYGRQTLNTGIDWVRNHNYTLVNVDTDSFTYTKNREMTEGELKADLAEVNSLFPEKIKWEEDGYFPSVVVLKAKNYVLWDGKKKKIKGSALRGSNREKALAEFIGRFSDLLLQQRFDDLVPLYDEYVKEILSVKDISRWCTKKTITSKVLNPERTNEAKVLTALEGTEYSEGDKRWFYFSTDGSLRLQEAWVGDHDVIKLLEKLFKTVKIFDSVIDISQFPNYSLKKNQKKLNG